MHVEVLHLEPQHLGIAFVPDTQSCGDSDAVPTQYTSLFVKVPGPVQRYRQEYSSVYGVEVPSQAVQFKLEEPRKWGFGTSVVMFLS